MGCLRRFGDRAPAVPSPREISERKTRCVAILSGPALRSPWELGRLGMKRSGDHSFAHESRAQKLLFNYRTGGMTVSTRNAVKCRYERAAPICDSGMNAGAGRGIAWQKSAPHKDSASFRRMSLQRPRRHRRRSQSESRAICRRCNTDARCRIRSCRRRGLCLRSEFAGKRAGPSIL